MESIIAHPIAVKKINALTNDIVCDTICCEGPTVASVDSIIEKMYRQPNGIRMSEAHKVLTAKGFRLDRQKDSHRQYIDSSGDVITVKDENPIKAVYVKDILSRI
jgi:predicted RNA binding protein YcfA (HicA-like mRNA interferase family)